MDLKKELLRLKEWQGVRLSGKVTHVIGMLIESLGPDVFIGEMCHVYGKKGKIIPCQVVGFKENKVLLMALGEMSHISLGAEVYPTNEVQQVAVSDNLCGRILDAFGQPIDGKGEIKASHYYPVTAAPPSPLKRVRISEILQTGIKAIDGFLTIGRGQRVGIFSGSGVGKSTLMGMIANRAKADINVIALIGERGREVREFIEKELKKDGLKKSVVIVATSDQPAPLRIKGANVATAIAEYFRDQGKNVILMMDSITRFAMAQREIGLAIGEPPTTRGYPPSVFALLPSLLERAGNSDVGSITAFYSVLAEQDELQDPILDQMRSLLDGHIFLSRLLSQASHFPPIDILNSLSRVMSSVVLPSHQKKAEEIRELMQVYKEAEELINIGAYVHGSNPKIDLALSKMKSVSAFLRQEAQEYLSYEESVKKLQVL